MAALDVNGLSGSTNISGEIITKFVIIPNRNVPTLSKWGLIAMASILGVVGFVVLRRKIVSA